MSMTKQQISYAMERVKQILNDKSCELKKKFTVEEKSVSCVDRAILIRTGKVKLKKGITSVGKYDNVVDVFDFSYYERESELNYEKYCKALEPFNKEAQKINDNLMLGDSTEALKAIEKFATLCKK